MPELPEVETVRRGLEPYLTGARLVRVVQNRPDLRFPFPEDFVARLTGARVAAVRRRAKYLLAPLDTGETLVAHLGMTGRFTIDARAPGRFHHPAAVAEKHDHFLFETDAGVSIAFNDARRFGYVDLVPTAAVSEHPYFRDLGPEPLGPDFSAEGLRRALIGRTQPIKASLLDQRIVAGLGNIYVVEALHRAGLRPERASNDLGPRLLGRLVREVRSVLEEAIESGGSTLRDYRSAEGALGYFQHRFRVYGREGEPCARPGCGGAVVRVVQSGRSSFFCPRCQK